MFKKNKNFSSISKQLLKVVFAFYFSVTIFMTIGQFVFEYFNAQNNIKLELKTISLTFEKSLERAMWNLDNKQIDSITQGIIKLPSIVAIEIYEKDSKEILHTKFSKEFKKNSPGVFNYKVDIYHTKLNSKKIYIGTIKYYSNLNIVLQRVQLSFLIIFIGSIIKSLLLTILFIWAFNKYLTKPLDEITSSILKIDLKHLATHKPITVYNTQNNEITFLAKAFNKMLKNLDKNLKSLKDTQEHLFQSEKMVALGNMVAGVAHEINTPIGMALTGSTHVNEITKNIKALYDNENMSQEDFENYLNDNIELNRSIQVSLQKATSLVKSFKKVSVDQSSNEIRTFNLNNYIKEVLLSLHNKLKQTNIKVLTNCQENIVIRSNPGAFSQIITNFIINSLIHGFENKKIGSITISAKIIDDTLEFVYSDSGKGLSKEVKEKIFDPFYTTKRDAGGSGLGMSIVYNLVTQTLKGTIEVISKENFGTAFHIKVPLHDTTKDS